MPTGIDLQPRFGPIAGGFIQSNSFIRGILGPVGSGKTSASLIDLFRRQTMVPPGKDGVRRSRAAVVRNTFRQLNDTSLKTWLRWFPEQDHPGALTMRMLKNEMSYTVQTADLHAEVLFRALDKPEDIERLKSMDLTFAFVNEASEIPLSIIDMLETRVGRYPPVDEVVDIAALRKEKGRDPTPEEVSKRFGKLIGWHGIMMDTNPPDDDHWWYWTAEVLDPVLKGLWERALAGEFKDGFQALHTAYDEIERIAHDWRGAEGHLVAIDNWLLNYFPKGEKKARQAFRGMCRKYEFFRQPSGLAADAENVEFLPPGYYERLCIGKSKAWIKVFVEANYGTLASGMPVFPDYDDTLHFDPKLLAPPRGATILRGWDFGRSPACVFSYLDSLGRWRVFDEMTARGMAIDKFSDVVIPYTREHYPEHRFVEYCDPSGFDKRGETDDVTAAMILAAKGINVEGGKQTWELRVNSVAKALTTFTAGKPNFLIGPKAKMTRRGLSGKYYYRKIATTVEKYDLKPEKTAESHPCDALTYIGTMIFGEDLLDPEPIGGVPSHFEDEIDKIWRETGENAGRSPVTGY